MSQNFSLDTIGTIMEITLNQPEKRNPFNENRLGEFEQIVMGFRHDRNSRAVILVETGNLFCAGADLSMVKGVPDVAKRRRLFAQKRIHRAWLKGRCFELFENLEQVSIAAIDGNALDGGGGLGPRL
jgi:enoyl-CoA hydratase/carnithine racemase